MEVNRHLHTSRHRSSVPHPCCDEDLETAGMNMISGNVSPLWASSNAFRDTVFSELTFGKTLFESVVWGILH